MDPVKAEIAANEAPEGMQTLFAAYNGDDGYYNCQYISDVPYATYGDKTLRLQIIRPAFFTGKVPLVIFVQGSAWRKQNLYATIPNLCHVAARGFVVASVEYRDTDLAGFPAQIEDVKAAIRFLRSQAAEFNVDPERVGVWGDSSGGHVALMTGMSPGRFTNDHHPGFSDAVDSIIDFYGITDIPSMGDYNDVLEHDAPDAPEALLIGGIVSENLEKAREASPFYWIDKAANVPVLLVHGDKDSIVHINQSTRFFKAMRTAGKNIQYYKVIGGEHGLGVWNRQVLDLVDRYLTATLKCPVLEKAPFQHQE